MITTEQIKELREKTGVSVMQCKKALEEAGGDIEKALILLRKISGNIAAKNPNLQIEVEITKGSGLIHKRERAEQLAMGRKNAQSGS